MKPWKSLTKLLIITLLALSANGVVSAKLASGPQNLSGAVHQGKTVFNPLTYLVKINFSTTNMSGSSVVIKSAGKARNKPPAPLKEAKGRPHSIIERPGKDGQYTTHYGDGTWKQYRGSGQDHGGIPRPNVKEAGKNFTPNGRVFIDKGRVRPPRPDEMPGG